MTDMLARQPSADAGCRTASLATAETGSPRPLRCQVVTDWEQVQALQPAWDALVQQVGGDVYLTLDWCRTWWKHFGRGREICILLFWEGEALVSLLPMVIDRLWLGPVPIRLARLLGSNCTTMVFNPPVDIRHAQAVYSTCLRHLLVEGTCDAVWFGQLSGYRSHRASVRQACEAYGPAVRIMRDHDCGVHTIFHLPETFEEYLASLDKSQRGNYRRDRRNLDKLYPLQLECLQEWEQAQGPFDEFVRMHGLQWQSQGMLGHFGDWPQSEPFKRDLARIMAPRGRLRLDCLRAGGQVVAYDFNFRLGEWLYWQLPARLTGEPWDRLGLGRVSLVARIEAAIATGIRHIEGGPGRYEYKVRMGATEYPMSSMLIAAGTKTAGAKTRLLQHWGDLLHLLYYRIWFSRIAPHLPLPRRPLWWMWILSRV